LSASRASQAERRRLGDCDVVGFFQPSGRRGFVEGEPQGAARERRAAALNGSTKAIRSATRGISLPTALTAAKTSSSSSSRRAPVRSKRSQQVFKYPAGGSIVATFTGSFEFPLGVVAAQKQKGVKGLMNSTGLKYTSALAALAICAACGNGSATAPSTAGLNYQYVGKTLSVNGRLVTAARPLSALPRYMTIVPDRRAKANDFEYIINYYGTYAGIFDYPKSVKEIGQINDVGGQGCTNVLFGYGKKIFWIVAGDTEINEYQVPKKPIKTLSDSVGMPSSCAMDTSGDLAVGILDGTGSGDVVIYKNASGSGTVYTTPLSEEYFDGYDSKGNLFADGFSLRSGTFGLVELPKGSSTFETITPSNTVEFPGSVQWDGKYLTVFDQETNDIYQYTVSGTKATLKGTVSLQGSSDCAQTWNVGSLIYCGDASNENGEVFKYPAGGSIVATFTGNFDFPLGVVAAKK
jgi:hypothetical protein